MNIAARALAAISMAAASLLAPATQQPYFRESLPNLHINDIAQDSLGFVWIGTANGLARCNGMEGYSVYFNDARNPHSLPNNFVAGMELYGDTLWIATYGGVCSKPSGSNIFTLYKPGKGAAEGTIAKLGFLQFNGKLYTHGYGGIDEINVEEKCLIPRINERSAYEARVTPDGSQLWIVTGDRLKGYDKDLHVIADVPVVADGSARTLLPLGNELLIGTSNGILRYAPRSQSLYRNRADDHFLGKKVHHISPPSFGRLLVSTSGGGVEAYYHDDGRVVPVLDNFQLESIPSDEVTVTHIDGDRNLWVGTFDKGAFVLSPRQSIFNAEPQLTDAFEGQFVTRVVESPVSGMMFVGTRYNGLGAYDRSSRTIRRYNQQNTPWLSLGTTKGDFVQHLFIDSNRRLWIGYNRDLVVAQITPDGQLEHLKTFPNVGDVVTSAEDGHGRVWIGYSDRGLEVFSSALNSEKKILPAPRANVTTIRPFGASKMLISVFGTGLYTVDVTNFKTLPFVTQHTGELRNVVDVCVASDGKIWVGTYGDGLLRIDPRNNELKRYNSFDTNDFVAVAEDPDHNIFASSSYGLYRLNPATSLYSTYLEKHGTLGNQYHEKCKLVDTRGNLYFGGNAGLQQVSPRNILPESEHMRVYLTDVKHLRKPNEGPDSVYAPDYSTTASISLPYDDNSVEMDFAALSYHFPVEYSYFLEGFDKNWIESGYRTEAVYSNLPAGDYRLLVRTRHDTEWSAPTELLRLSVRPAPWLHPLAKLAYVLLLIALFFMSTRLYIRMRLERRRFALAEERVRMERENTQHKINFFTNVSHEIRTPITLIYAPVKYLERSFREMPPEKVQATLAYIDRNVERLLTLTNQLLRFHDVKQETLPLRVGRYDCIKQLDGIVRIYNVYASEKGQIVTLVSPYTSYICTYDRDKLEKIMNNLLFNATKYTPTGGHITVKAEITRLPEGAEVASGFNYLEIQVIDDGMGIPDDEESRQGLFQRFRRLVGSGLRTRISGYGVGLNYVKELVACHKGVITPRRNMVRGMTFIVALPIDDAAFAPSEHESRSDIKPTTGTASAQSSEGQDDASKNGGLEATELPVSPYTPVEPQGGVGGAAIPEKGLNEKDREDSQEMDEDADEAAEETSVAERPTLLLVEDNQELLDFMATIFSDRFEVLRALNGQRALEAAQAKMPDVIISDVLMPQMDGYTFCREIKNNQDTCHIPVILLTAKTMDEDRIEGYHAGADLYVDKPFNPDVISSAIDGVLARAERHKREISQAMTEGTDQLDGEQLNPLDRRFLARLNEYINSNLSNTDLNVNLLDRELGFSRTNFYRKVKQLTGSTPNDLLRLARLRMAAQMLSERTHTVGEISDICGFGTQSHFSSSFKKQYGLTPREFMSRPSTPQGE